MNSVYVGHFDGGWWGAGAYVTGESVHIGWLKMSLLLVHPA